MSGTVDVRLVLRFGGDLTFRPARVEIGEALQLRIEAQDTSTGLPVAATGLAVVATRPDRLQLQFDEGELELIAAGVWLLTVALDVAGTWRFRATSEGPSPSAREITATVTPTAADALEAGPALVTRDLSPIVTQAGGVLTVARITSLPEATEVAGLVLAGAQRDAAVHMTGEALLAAAAGAGSGSGAATGATAGAEAGAISGAEAGAAAAVPYAEAAAESATAAATVATSAADAEVAAALARDQAQAAAANGRLRYATLTALQANLAPAANAVAEVDSDGSNNGTYIKVGAIGSGSWSRINTATVTALDVAAQALAARVTPREAQLDTLALRAASDRHYSGSNEVVPEVTALDSSGAERMVRGIRSSDGAQMFYAALDGEGFSASVGREVSPLITDYQFTGAGIYPIVMLGQQAPIYYDADQGRVAIHDVLVKGDHGLEIDPPVEPIAPRTVDATTILGIVPYGQSLSVGARGQPALTTSQPYSNITFVGGVKSTSTGAKASFGPLVEDDLGEDNATGTNRGETVSSAAANYVTRLAAIENGIAPASCVVFACNPGQGGRPIAQLVQGQSYYTRLLAQITSAKALATAAGKSFAVHAIPWLQGETDCDNGTTGTDYLAAQLDLVADLNTDIKAITGQTTPVHLLTYQTAYKTVTSAAEIVLAQFRGVEQSGLIHFVGPIHHMDYHSDHLHLVNTGYIWFGHYIGRAYKQLVVDGRVPDCVWPISATAVGHTLSIKFRVPVAPLVFDTSTLPATTDHGFKVVDDTGTLTLSSPTVVNGDTVRWTLNRSLGANPKARYALDYNATATTGAASGNLRDSTTDTVPVNGVSRPLWHTAPHFQLPIIVLPE